METLGSLSDKLSVVNSKIYEAENIRRDLSRPSDERLKRADAIISLNAQRNSLKEEIDQLFHESIQRGWAPRSPENKQY